MPLRTFTRQLGHRSWRCCSHRPPLPCSRPVPRRRRRSSSFFANPVLGERQAVAERALPGGHLGRAGRRDYLVVIDLQTKNAKLVAGYSDIDIQAFEWVNDNRLVFNMIDRQVAVSATRMRRDCTRSTATAPTCASWPTAGASASSGRRHPHQIARLLPWHTFMLGQPGAQDSDFIYVKSYEFDENLRELHAHRPAETEYADRLRPDRRTPGAR